MSISKVAREIAASPTLKLNAAANKLRAAGLPVIHLGAGEPKSIAPVEAIHAAKVKLATGEIRYCATAGIPELIKAIADYTEKNYGQSIDNANVIVSSGAKHAIYNLMMSIVDPNDEVILLAPYWVSYPEIVKMLYGVPVIVTPKDKNFIPTIEEITEAITPSTKAIIVNSPNNPSGAVYPEKLIAELVEYCEKKDIYLVMDDIYHKLIFDGTIWTSAYKYMKSDIDSSKLVIINGVSKSYAMTGFRIGWTIANRELAKTMIKIAAQTTTCVSIVLQVAAAAALKADQSGVEDLRVTLQKNASIMINELRTLDKLKIGEPKGTFYCLPDFSAYEPDCMKLSELLVEKALVVAVPGRDFGLKGFLRLSYCGRAKDIIEAIARIRWALDPNSPDEIYIGDKKHKRDWL